MFNENAKFRGNEDSEKISLMTQSNDPVGVYVTGHIEDKIFKNGVLVDTRVGHNLIVDSFLKLVMCLLKRQSGYTGIQYWAVGSGSDSWDSNMPSPEAGATRLTKEIGRVAISPSEVTFLNDNYEETSSPTNIIQIRHTFGTNDCNGVWREFGIFGGNATNSSNSGILINKRHHAILTKTEEMTVERTMRFTINLA